MNGLRNKKVLISTIFVVFLITLGLIGIYVKKRPLSPENPWQTYNKRVDYVTKNGQLIRDDNRRDGITILPPNYQEKNVQYKITTYNFADKTEKTHALFDSLPEFTNVKLLPNVVDPSKLWALIFRADVCTNDSINPRDNTTPRGDCKFKLFEFDLGTDKLVEKKELRFWVGTPVRDVYLLTHDVNKNIVWLGVDYQVSQGETQQWKNQLPDLVDLNRQYFATDLIKYNANSNDSQIVQTPYWMSSRFNPLHKTLAKAGKDDELYFLGECDIKCGDQKYINEGVAVVQNNKILPLPIFYYGQNLGPVRYFQITTDVQNNYVYVITKSFDQNKPSGIFRYDITTGRSTYIGKQPTQEDDDVRGLDTIGGNLVIGSFNGLAVYNPSLDSWKVIGQSDGIKSNNVEGVYEINNGGVCVLHENDGASCLFEPLSKYVQGGTNTDWK